MEKGQLVAARRDTGEKAFLPVAEAAGRLRALLDDIQTSLFRRALEFRQKNTFSTDSPAELAKLLDDPGGFVEAGWCGDPACEAKVKEETKATIRLLPLEKKDTQGRACVACGKAALHIAVFGKAY
ncbi:MAG: proline--tRNA ligase, partial [Acidobacteria bacterium]|nr:proline--tRNA ligase [Acidobacteriota bacterium]